MASSESAIRCAALLVVRFLDSQIGQAADDVRESIELARDCVTQSFNLNDPANEKSAAELIGNSTLVGLVENMSSVKDTATALKNKGNDLMREGKFEEAAQCYTDAIKYAPNNAILYCNRAAARARLEQFDQAISDSRTAIGLDPNYAKAWGRLGSSLSARGSHIEAAEAFKRASEIEPDVVAWKEGLEKETAAVGTPGSGMGGGGGMGSFGGSPNSFMNLLQSPQMLQMAQQMMSDPNMSRMFQNVLAGSGGMGGGGMPPNMDSIMQMAQNFAQQMETQNPELINRLRNQYGPRGQDGQQPPQPPPM